MGLLGLDIGTSGCKATIIDFDGNVRAEASAEYPLLSPQPGWQELDPVVVWESVKRVIAGVTAGYRGEAVKAMSVSSFGEAVTPVDPDGNVLNNSLIYIDPRGREEADCLERRLGTEKVLRIAGTAIHPMYSLCKIMWLKKHRPEVYVRTWKFMLYADFVLFKLGAKPHTDYSLAARTLAFDVVKKHWSEEILAAAEIDPAKFCEPVQSGTIVGEVSAEIADELGLHRGVTLVAGGHDQPCAALGAGVIHDRIAVDGMGSTECITPAFDRALIGPAMAASGFACVPHVKACMYVTYAFNFTSGSLLRWFRDNFAGEYLVEANQSGRNIYEVIIDRAPYGPSGLLLLPHFAGAATPHMDPTALGAIVGLTINTGKPELIKAILEGITYEMMFNLERLRESGIEVEELRAVGGMAKSEQFLQLKADMMGKRIVSLHVSEAGTLGVAILAAVASGIYPSLEAAVAKLVKTRQVFLPDERQTARYQESFEQYKRLYPAVKTVLR